MSDFRGKLVIWYRPRIKLSDGDSVERLPQNGRFQVAVDFAPGIIYKTNFVPSDTHFTLVMYGERRNWVVTNITYLNYNLGELDVWNGNTISEYLPPLSGVHTFVLYQQGGLNVAKKFDDDNREMFNLDKFASDYSLYELVRADIDVKLVK
jgi:hypothetical protein